MLCRGVLEDARKLQWWKEGMPDEEQLGDLKGVIG